MDEFTKQLEQGWDNGIEWYEKEYGKDIYTNIYWGAYNFMTEYNDTDNGICFIMREYAVGKIAEKLKGARK